MTLRAAPLIHIGLHKTGTTWLQNGLFCDSSAGFSSPWARDEILERFVLLNPLRYDADHLRSALARGIEFADQKGCVPVLSHERLSGNPHSGGYDRLALADRLIDALPEAKVLIVIREQISMIASTYKQYVREGGASSLWRYLYPPTQGIARVPLFSFDYFAYDDLIKCYSDRFGPDRVLVLPYELLRKAPEDFAARIARFADLPEVSGISPSTQNAGLSAIAAGCKRRLNLPLVRDRVNPAGMIGDPRFNVALDRLFGLFDRFLPRGVRAAGERRLKSRIQEFVGSRYCESNQRTSDISGLDLGSLGYQMPGTHMGEN